MWELQDVVCEMYGTLLARGFVSALTLAPLQVCPRPSPNLDDDMPALWMLVLYACV